MTSPIPQSAADQGASPHAPAAEVATSSNPPGSTSPLIEPALTEAVVVHRAHDWAADTRGRPPSAKRERWEQRVWHTEYEGGSVSATAWKDTRGEPSVSLALIGRQHFPADVAERIAGPYYSASLARDALREHVRWRHE